MILDYVWIYVHYMHTIQKQKYPFLLIENCLPRLNRKLVFTTLLDGFHQIKIHPDSMKYFSFATSNDQFEYKRLSFGYSEAPVEFQN